MTCPTCHGTGLRYEGTGHRIGGYPFAEKNTSTECFCAAGDDLVKERKDADQRNSVEVYAAREDYITKRRDEMYEATRRMEIESGLRFCPKCDTRKPREGFQVFDICGECLDKTVIKEK